MAALFPATHPLSVAILALALALSLAACSDASPSPAPSPPPPPDPPLTPLYLSLLYPPPPPLAARPLSPRAAAALSADLAAHARAAAEGPAPALRTLPGPPPFLLAAGDAAAPLPGALALATRLTDFLYGPDAPPTPPATRTPFAHRCERATTVWLYGSPGAYLRGVTEHAWDAVGPPALGLYDPNTRAIVARTDPAGGISTALHELAHPLLECDFPLAPRWLAEGVASLFELPDLSKPGEIHGKAHFRLQTLRTALASPPRPVPGVPTNVSLENLFESRGAVFLAEYGAQPLYFAMAREALRWLDQRAGGQLWPFYQAWRDGVLEDGKGYKAFEKVVGKSPAEASAEWVAWIGSPEAERPR